MLPQTGPQFPLLEKIARWTEEVGRQAQPTQQRIPQQAFPPQCLGYRERLRSTAQRPKLTEISSNPQPRKRKAAQGPSPTHTQLKRVKTMMSTRSGKGRQDSHQGGGEKVQPEEGQAKRGRPRGTKKQKAIQEQECQPELDDEEDETDLPIRSIKTQFSSNPSILDSCPILAPNKSASSRMTSKSRNRSPNKKGTQFLHQETSEATIDLRFLERCTPAVKMRSFHQIRQGEVGHAPTRIPKEVIKLRDQMTEIPLGVIPSELKRLYEADADSPHKSRKPPRKGQYLDEGETPFPSITLERLKVIVDRVVKDTQWNFVNEAHERQWGLQLTLILNEMSMWPSGERWKLLNVEACPILPFDFRPLMPNGYPIDYDVDAIETSKTETSSTTEQTQSGSSKARTVQDTAQPMGRMIDWCLALDLTAEQTDTMNEVFSEVRPNERSLNQTRSFVESCPIWADIEVKKSHTTRTPEVQLAIWACGGYLKRKHHGWDVTMPMPAIAINGATWSFYIFFPLNGKLIMMGPEDFGTTKNTDGVWQIIYRLNLLIEWGQTTYTKWFEENVLANFHPPTPIREFELPRPAKPVSTQ